MRKPGSDFVGSFEKGLRVIQAFDAAHPEMTLTEVADRTGLDRAAARRFLLTLVDLGFATHREKRFRLTARILNLGYAFLSSLGLPEQLSPFLKEVSTALGESSSAAVLDDVEIVYIARVQTSRIISVALGIGARLPAAATSMGRVLVAALEPDERARRIERCPLERHTEWTVTDRAELARRIEAVQVEGFAMVDQELESGLRSLAVPVRDKRGEVVAAMNVSTQVGRVSIDELLGRHLPILREAAERARAAIP